MKAIVSIQQHEINHRPTNSVNARELWEALEVKTRFNDWIQRRIDDSMFVEGQDYIVVTQKRVTEGNTYIISIEMAKHLAMMEKTGKGFEVRQYFIRCEEELQRQVHAKPMSQLEILQQSINALVEQSQRVAVVESKVALLEAKQADYEIGHYTISAYRSMNNLPELTPSEAQRAGKRATELSKEMGYKIATVPHPRFVKTNTYHTDVLDVLFSEEL